VGFLFRNCCSFTNNMKTMTL